MRSALVLLAPTVAASAFAQTAAPLPPNYKVVLDNPYVQVQRVHYGPREFVPMHDHYPVVTVLVYLNNSGVVEIAHEGPDAEVIKRPPTHTGAWRIGPAAFERHSVRNLGDVPSDFFRVELKRYPPDALKDQVRGPAPTPPLQDGVATEYRDAHLRIDRIVCAAGSPCSLPADAAPSVLLTIPNGAVPATTLGLVQWIAAGKSTTVQGGEDHAQFLRVLLPQP